jgi:succinate-semialdehyde dehydrogenase / glutarate-semialdehyde dehydrogenase
MGARKIAPALAAGCTTVTKPAPDTPLTTLALARLIEECGAPPGIVNVVTTQNAGEVVDAMLADPRARKLSFTGSTAVGRHLLSKASGSVLRTSMELGGNAPLIVCSDSDLDTAVSGAMIAKMRNMGASCVAANRILVQSEVADAFTERFCDAMATLTVGPGFVAGIDVGPMIHEEALTGVHELVRDARRTGARVEVGGEPLSSRFYPPTVLTDVAPWSHLLKQEIFGPVAPIVRFDADDEAIAIANDTEYGLVAYVFTTDLQRALHYTEELDVGMLGVNRGLVSDPAAPFGGIKQSGLGREGGPEGLEEYLDLTYAAVDLT